MKHDLLCEERLFSADITALREFDEGFNQAWNDESSYVLEINLPTLFEICPRKYSRTYQYKRLANFLAAKNITLRVVSRKNKNNKNNDYGTEN